MTPESVTAIVEAAAAAVAIARLYALQLAGDFPALLCFLFAITATAGAGSFLAPNSRPYFWLYIFETPIYCFLAMISARELFALVFREYPGIRTVGRKAVYWCAACAFAFSVVVALKSSAPNAFRSNLAYLAWAELGRRFIVLSIALFIALILFSLSRYPLRLRRNILVSSGMFCILFLSQAAQLLIDYLSPYLYSRLVDIVDVVFGAACIAVWTALLRPEQAPAAKIVRFAPAHEEQLRAQLESLDRLLTRAARQ